MYPDRRPVLRRGSSGEMEFLGFEEPAVSNTARSNAVHVLPDRHIGFPCRQCQLADYQGLRHSCFFCKDYHLCGNCFARNDRPESPHHKYYHIMQVFYTRTTYALYFGGEPYTDTADWQSFQCALCLRLGFTIQALYQHLLQSHRDHPDHQDYLLMTFWYYFVDRSSRDVAPTPPTAAGVVPFQVFQDLLATSFPSRVADPPTPESEVFPDTAADTVPIIELEIRGIAQVLAARSTNRRAATAAAPATATVAGAGASNAGMVHALRALQHVRDRLQSLDRNCEEYQAVCMGLLMRARGLRERYGLSNNATGNGSDIDRICRQIEREAFARLQGGQSTFVLGEVPAAAPPAASSGLIPLFRRQEPAPTVAGCRAAAMHLLDRFQPNGTPIHPSMTLLFRRHRPGNRSVPISNRSSHASMARYETLNRYASLRSTHQAGPGPHGVQAGVPRRIPTSTQTVVAAPPPNTGPAITELATVAEPVPPENPIDKLDLNDGRFLCSRLKERFEKMPGNTEEERKVSKARLVDAVVCSMLSEKDLTAVPVNLLLMQELGSTATTAVAPNEPKPLEEALTIACGAEEGLNQVPRLMQLAQNVIQDRESAVDPMIKYCKGLVDYKNWLGRLTISLEAKKGATGTEATKGSKKTEAKKGSKEPEAQPTSSNRYLENILQISSSGNNGQDGDILGAGINDGPHDQNPIAFIDRNDGDGEDDESIDDDSNDSKMGNDFANDDNDNGNVADNNTNDDARNTYPYPMNLFAAPGLIESELSVDEVSVDEDEDEDDDLYNGYDYETHFWDN